MKQNLVQTDRKAGYRVAPQLKIKLDSEKQQKITEILQDRKKVTQDFRRWHEIAQYSRQNEEKAHDKGCLGKNVSWLNFIFQIFLLQYVKYVMCSKLWY